jgi:tRNA (guanine-N7-)-methyltransferase
MEQDISLTKHFYGRRKGRPLRVGREQSLQQARTEHFIAPQIIETQDLIYPRVLFNRDFSDYWLEIGFGNGEHLTGQAQHNPSIGMIGCEAFLNGVSMAAQEASEKNLDNIRFWDDDALPLIKSLADNSLARIFLLFPDPWPKTRHYKRRFIQTETVDLLVHKLRVGGILRLATDDRPLAEWMLLHAVRHEYLIWDQWPTGDWRTPPQDWIETRYQQKAAQQGRQGHFMDFIKKDK